MQAELVAQLAAQDQVVRTMRERLFDAEQEKRRLDYPQWKVRRFREFDSELSTLRRT